METKILKIKTIALLILFVTSISLLAQERNIFKEKLNSLKGNVEKITVRVDGKEIEFKDDEAKKIVKMLKPNFMVNDEQDEFPSLHKKKMMMFNFNDSNDEAIDAKEKKKIKVEINKGKKIVTVTTFKDGKEEVNKYEGEEAEKFLKESEKEGDIKVIIADDKEIESYPMHKMKKHNCCCNDSDLKIQHPHKRMFFKDIDDDKEIIIEKKIDKNTESKEK